MPLFKTGHKPKTHMATTPPDMAPTPSEFRIEGLKRDEYKQNTERPTDQDEKEMRRAIVKYAEKTKPGNVQWMYFWTNQQ